MDGDFTRATVPLRGVPCTAPTVFTVVFQPKRPGIRLAIISAGAGACTQALIEQVASKASADEAHPALRREMDVLAALRVHERALKESRAVDD